jgi:HEAT repeat protein
MAQGLRKQHYSDVEYYLNILEVIMKKTFAVILFAVFIASSFAIAVEPESVAPFDEKEYNEYLTKSLKDPNLGIRFSAAKIIGERRVYEAKDELVTMLKKDKEYQNRIAAGIALMEMGDDKVFDEIVKQSKKDKNKTVRHVLAGITNELQSKRLLTANN